MWQKTLCIWMTTYGPIDVRELTSKSFTDFYTHAGNLNMTSCGIYMTRESY